MLLLNADVVPTDQLIEWLSGATWRPGIAHGDNR